MLNIIRATMRSLHCDALQDFHVICSVILCLLSSIVVSALKHRRSRFPLPPGPYSLPFIGHKFGPYAWRQMEAITKKYGPVSSVRLGSELLVIIGTVKPAVALLEGRSGIYCDRPRLEMAGNVISGGLRTICLGYNDRWRRFRRVLHSQLDNQSATFYEPIQERASRQLVLDVLENPTLYREALTRYAAGVIMKVTYGKVSPTCHDDKEVILVSRSLTRFFKAAKLGAYAIDRFRWLRHVPGWISQGKKWHAEELELFSSQVENVRRSLDNSGARDNCFASYMLERQTEFSLSDQEAAYLAGSLFGAGSDTTSAALCVIIFAALCHPKEAKKVQDEIERVVGSNKMPTFSDQMDLPTVTAFFNETFRWRPVSAAGFMHATVKDDYYDGFFIPRGSWVVGNHWSIHRDESVFPEPEKFDISRWLKVDETGKTILRSDIRHFAYGFGRRRCAGVNVADRSMFITTANLLWSFDIRKPRNCGGKEFEIDTMAFEDSANSRPKPFPVEFIPRRNDIKKLIEEMGTC